MSGIDYRDRLARARLFWSAFVGAIWGAYTLAAGWDTDVTIVLGIVWFLAFQEIWQRHWPGLNIAFMIWMMPLMMKCAIIKISIAEPWWS